MPVLSHRSIRLRWLPPIIYIGLILVMSIGLFGLIRLQDIQAASTVADQPVGNQP